MGPHAKAFAAEMKLCWRVGFETRVVVVVVMVVSAFWSSN